MRRSYRSRPRRRRRRSRRSAKAADPVRQLTTLLSAIGVAEGHINKADKALSSGTSGASYDRAIGQAIKVASDRIESAFNAIDDLGALVEETRDDLSSG